MSRSILVLSLSLVACAPTLQDGRFTCSVDTDCPTGFACRADALCYRGAGSDGGTPITDTGIDAHLAPMDAGTDAFVPFEASTPDAATACGPNCIQVIVLNADPSLSGDLQWTDTNSMPQHIGIPPYGQTTATTDVHNLSVGGTWSVFAPGSLTTSHDLAIPDPTRYLLVLGPSSFGAGIRLLAQPMVGLHTGNYVYLNVIDMTDDLTGLLVSGAGRDASAQAHRNALSSTMDATLLPFLPSAPGAMRIEIAGTSSPPLVAALLDEQISATEGTYYMVVAGSIQRHLADPGGVGVAGGLRFIPGLPSAMAQPSSRLVRVVNTLSASVTVCDGGTMLQVLTAGAMSDPMIPPHATAWTLTVHTSPDCSTGTSHDAVVPVTVGRTLVSIAGDPTATWSATPIAEPVPTPGGFAQTIVIQNGLATTSDIATATGIVSLSTSSANFSSRATQVTATTPGGTKTFDWSPMARQSWLVVGQPGGGLYKAFEVDSPYDAAWTLTIQPGT